MKDIRDKSNGNVKFVGAGGPKMAEQGLEDSLYDMNTYDGKAFHPFRSLDATRWNWWLWAPFNPVTYKHNKPMWDTLKFIEKEDTMNKIMQHRPSSVITIGHEQLSVRIHEKLAHLYEKSSLDRPSQIHYGKFIKNMLIQEQKHLDHVLYTIPIDNPNFNYNRQFPGTYVGQSPFERALRYLLEKWDTEESFIRPESVMMSRSHFYEETEPFILKEREEFRKKFDIPEDNTVFFMAPGDAENEVKWSLPIMERTVRMLMDQLQNRGINTNEFSVVIPTTPNSAKHIKSAIEGEWGCRVIFTETHEEKYSALAGSDIGVCFNGEVAAEALVNQLPIIVLDKLNKLEFYFMLSWNRFVNDMNIIADGPLFKEIIEAEANPTKLCSVLTQWMESPAHRLWPLEGFEMHLNRMLPLKTRELGMGNHDEYHSPDKRAAEVIWNLTQEKEARQFPAEDNEFCRIMKAS